MGACEFERVRVEKSKLIPFVGVEKDLKCCFSWASQPDKISVRKRHSRVCKKVSFLCSKIEFDLLSAFRLKLEVLCGTFKKIAVSRW